MNHFEEEFDIENMPLERTREDLIRDYGLSVNNFHVSPYESVNMFDIRDILLENEEELTDKQKQLLKSHDEFLLFNASKMFRYIQESKAYNFEYSKEVPLEQWWWHLDKIAKGSLVVSL